MRYDIDMDLQQFFPYRLARLAEAVSQATAQVYSERFDLTRDEWRVLAALAEAGAVKTAQVLESTTLDKMRVSRALARMEKAELIERSPDPDDGRGQRVRLLPPGRALYRKIVPMVQAREAYLLEALEPAERAALDKAMDKVRERAVQLTRQG
jgi:DNA-binding MarR family transcriptional regulator